MKTKDFRVKIIHVTVQGNQTKEQLEKILTESRELTLRRAMSTITERQKNGTQEVLFSQHSDIIDTTNERSLTARYMATLLEQGKVAGANILLGGRTKVCQGCLFGNTELPDEK